MKTQLALRLLSDLLKWDTPTATQEFSWLRIMVDAKFDHYQGYAPGQRFFVHLIHWLAQFTKLEERHVAYHFMKERMVWISRGEINHLVSLSYPVIQREIRRSIAAEKGLRMHQSWLDPDVREAICQSEFRTLFVALSDGAWIDVFRRENEGVISNEQVVASAEITERKWDDLRGELRKRLAELKCPDNSAVFERICLIDDFTGSGASLIRWDEDEDKWKGKVARFCDMAAAYTNTHLKAGSVIHAHHYLASTSAVQNIEDLLGQYAKVREEFSFIATYCNVLRPDDKIDAKAAPDLVKIITDYYDSTCENKHTKKDIWFGYRQSGLPLVLEHNTPNNSIALLWAAGEHPNKMRPLFPRKQRHKDHGQSL